MAKGKLVGKVVATVVVTAMVSSGIYGFINGLIYHDKSMLWMGVFVFVISIISFPIIWLKE